MVKVVIPKRVNFLVARKMCLLYSFVAISVCLIYIPYLGELAFHHEEPRRALIARDMVSSGEYFVPKLDGQVYLAKPPLFNWAVVGAGAIFGEINELSARLISVVALLLLALAMLYLLRLHLNFGALIFFAIGIVFSPEFANKARLAEIELLFTLFVSLSIWVWFNAYQRGETGFKLWLLPSLFTGLAFITKREPAILFYYLSIAGYLVYEGKFKQLFAWQQVVSGVVILLIAFIWLGPVLNQVSLSAFTENSKVEVMQRELDTGVLDYLFNVVTYPLEICLALLPFSVFLFFLLFKKVRVSVIQTHSKICAFCIIALLCNVPVYLFRGDIAVRYFLPMFPTVLVLCAIIYQSLIELSRQGYEKIIGALFFQRIVGFVTLGLLMVQIFRLLPFFDLKQPQVINTNLAVFILLSLLLAMLYVVRKFWVNIEKGLMLTCLLFSLNIQMVYFTFQLPREVFKITTQRDIGTLIETIERHIPEGMRPIQTIGFLPYDIWYYAPVNTFVYVDSQSDKIEVRPYFFGLEENIKEADISYETIYEHRYRGRVMILGYEHKKKLKG